MENNKYKQLQKDVNRLNQEGFVPEGQQLRVFRNADELIEAIRRNEVPGITWDDESERKWQEQLHLEQCYNDSRTEEDDLNE